MKYILLLFLSFTIIGCATMGGKQIDSSRASSIQDGITTKDQVIDLIGLPQKEIMNPDNTFTMLYWYRHVQPTATSVIPVVNIFSSGVSTDQQRLEITLDNNNIVIRHFLSNTTNTRQTGLF
jgi:hypothetical protein